MENEPKFLSNTIYRADIAVECDYRYFQMMGNNKDLAIKHAMSIYGAVSALYQEQLDCFFNISYFKLWTSYDPYDGTGAAEIMVFFAVYGETSTPPVDGLEEGESMVYKVWDESEDQEYDSVTVTHNDYLGNSIDDEFDTSVPFKEIATFFAFKLDTPELFSPANNATDQGLSTQLSWLAVDDALTYNLQLSANSDMSSPLVNITGISSSSYTVPDGTLNNLTKYYWQVQAVRNEHESIWSDIRNYTTTDQEDKFVDLTMAYKGFAKSSGHKIMSVMIELRSGDDLMESTIVTQRAALLNSDGEAEINLYDIDNGDYWIVVRASGFLPVAIPEKQSLSADGISWDFTTSSTQSVLGAYAMQNVGGVWQICPGDLDPDGAIGAFDVNALLPHLGKSIKSGIPSE